MRIRPLPRTALLFCAVLLAGLMAGDVARADFDKGRAAFERGDFATVRILAEREARRGDPEAQTYLGILYFYGQGGLPHDHKKAAQWYRVAADQGYNQAQLNLGVMYATGDGVPHDLVEAYKWFTLAIKGGGPLAQQNQALAKRKLTKAQLEEAEKRIKDWENSRGK